MNAEKIISEMEKLSPDEKQKVAEYFNHLEDEFINLSFLLKKFYFT